jgi:uncharacterized protein (DUF2141 family)
VTVQFNKYVDPSVRSVVIVQPDVPFRTSYAGNEISVDFQRELDSNTTYSVTIGTDYQDTHGNRPQQAATLVFSTGALIDTGTITGTVRAAAKENLVVFCYALDGVLADTLMPSHTAPRYRIPVGTSGSFTVSGLHDGSYRVMAVVDANRNNLLDPNEEFGMPTADVMVQGGKAHPVMLRTGPPLDVFKPYITRARSTSARTVTVQFSENIDSSRCTLTSVRITDSASALVALASVVIDARDRLQIHTAEALREGQYTVHGDTSVIRDSAGNACADTGKPITFTASLRPDTTTLRIGSTSWADSAKRVEHLAPFDVRFTDAMDTTAGIAQPFTTMWLSPIVLRIVRDRWQKPGTTDSFAVQLRGFRSVLGVPLPDTTLIRRFSIADREDPGMVTGVLRDSLHTGGPYLIRVVGDRDSVVATTLLREPGPWSISGVRAGTYVMDVVLDVNANGRYDHGQLMPYRPSEYVWTMKQQVRIRPRWTLEDVTIVLESE